MYTPDRPEGEISFVAIRQTIEPYGDNQYKMSFKGVETKNVSGLTVRKDLTLWVISFRWIYFYDRGYPRMPIGIIVAFGFIKRTVRFGLLHIQIKIGTV